MTQDMQDDTPHTSRSHTPPLTDNHFLLPLPGGKYAPRTLTFRRRQHELTHFLEVYDHICAHYKITNEAEKCKGIVTYCTSKVASMIEKLPSFNRGNYKKLVKDLYYFLEDDDHTYSISKVQSFTKKWRHRRIESLDQFKRYHRKYLELVGKAAGSKSMTEEDFNRYFWEGIHSSFRRKVENRMLVIDPDLDVSVPFDISQIVKAAGYLLNKRRFDQHLFAKSKYHSSDTDTDSEDDYRPKRVASGSESDEANDSEASQDSRTPLLKKKKSSPSPSPKSPFKHISHPKQADDNEVSKLITRMNKLSLGQLNQADPKQKAYLADVLKNLVEPPRNQYMPNPPRNQYNPGPPRREGYPQRDPPPHQRFGEPARNFPERTEVYCFGCGRAGHRILQCGELNALLNQGIIVRNSAGRLQWPDGSHVQKDREDSWVQAINKALKRTNIVKAEVHCPDSEEDDEEDEEDEEEDLYVGFTREEDDASSDEQEELGWTSGHVSDCYALGAERMPRVSRDTRRQVQFNPPSGSQGMQKFPQNRNTFRPGNQSLPITHSSHPHSSQPGAPKRITPMDVNQRKFEDKTDNQFLPMEVDQMPEVKPGNQATKVTPDQNRGKVSKVTNPRPKAGRSSSEIVQDIMKMPLTVTLEEAVNMSPTLRRDLTYASRVAREASSPAQEKSDKAGGPEKTEKTVLGSNVFHTPPSKSGTYHLDEPRDDLLKVPVRIGKATMTGVYDSGSQINVLSDKFAGKCGLPITTEGIERYKITGVNGGLARCVGIIPKAKIYVTDNEYVTIGDLVIIEHAGFDLLLGRPWITVNRAGTSEEDDGTHLVFKSKGIEFSVNVSPNPDYESKVAGVRGFPQTQPSTYVVAAASRVSDTEVPDSEPERDLPLTDASIEDWEPGEEVPQVVDQEENQEDEEQEEGTKEPDEEDRCWLEPPPRPPTYKEPDPFTAFEIETELHESYIKMVKRGAGNAEWDAFRKAKKQRLRKDRDLWKKWKSERGTIDVPESTQEPENHSPTPPEDSETLATCGAEDPPPQLVPSNPNDPKGTSVVTTTRRSKRVRKESRRAQESEEWQKMKNRRRVYERDEKIARKTVRMTRRSKHDDIVASYGAKLRTETLATDNSLEDNPNLTVVPPSIVIKDWENGSAPNQPSNHCKPNEWPLINNDCETTTYRRGKILIRERNLCAPPQSLEEAARPQPYNTGPLGWKITPGNGTYEDNKIYPWISREEMGIALDWVRNLPGTRGEHFLVHSIDNDEGIGITLGTRSPRSRDPAKQPVHRRVLELRREEEGSLTATPGHSIECIARLEREGSQCECGFSGNRVTFKIAPEPFAEKKHSPEPNLLSVPTLNQMMEKLTVVSGTVLATRPHNERVRVPRGTRRRGSREAYEGAVNSSPLMCGRRDKPRGSI